MALTSTELQVRWLWSDQILSVLHVQDGALRVGPGTPCDVVPELDSPLELARRGDEGWIVEVPAGHRVILDDGFETHSLSDARLSSVRLDGQERATLDFGSLRAELSLAPRPKPLAVSWSEQLDFRFLYVLVTAAFALGATIIVGNLEENPSDELDLPLPRAHPVSTHSDVRPPPKPQLTQSTTAPVPQAPSAPSPRSATKSLSHAAAHPGQSAAHLIHAMFDSSAIASLASGLGLGKGLEAALQGVGQGDQKVAGGIDGFGLRGGPLGGGGPGNTIGIGAIKTNHGPDYGTAGSLCGPEGCKKGTTVVIDSTLDTIVGGMDKELIRQVIHRNRAQIRYCYEQSLISSPQMSGKVDMHFVIGAEGDVLRAEVNVSTTHDPVLDHCLAARFKSWIFPKPKGGGVVDVNYPVILQRSGLP
jgi:hypothetical protein